MVVSAGVRETKKHRQDRQRRSRYRNFRLVDRYNGRQGADAETSNDTPNNHHRDTVCKCLKSTTYEENDRAIENGFPAADHIADASNKKGGYKCTHFKDGNHSPDGSAGGLVEVILEIPTTTYVSHLGPWV